MDIKEQIDRRNELTTSIDTDVGVIEYIDTRRRNKPVKLRWPYEYVVPARELKEGLKQIDTYLDGIEKSGKLQIGAVVGKKAISRGMRFSVFALSHASKISENEWLTICERTQQMLFDLLGPDALCYIYPFNDETKFSLHFHTYVMYKEMADV